MLSNKLTFSLVLVLMFAFVAGPALAQGFRNSSPLNTGVDVYDNSQRSQGMGKNGFVVYVKSDGDSENPAPNGTVDAEVITVTTFRGNSNFPNLEEFLRFGGTIELSLNIGEKGSSNHTIVSDTGAPAGTVDDPNTTNFDEVTLASRKAISDAVLAEFKHRLVISEIMWGLDGADDSKQWIEIYNNGDALKSRDDPRLRFYFNRKVNNLGKTYTLEYDDGFTEPRLVIDTVSTIDSFGRSWALKGQNGNTTAGTNPNDGTFRAPINLVSMYRKNDLTGVGLDTEYKDKSFGDGTHEDQWEATATRANMEGPYVGTPGRPPIANTATTKNPASISATGIIINEVRNDSSAANLDWIEIFYYGDPTTDNAININDYEINIVEADLTDGEFTNANKQPQRESLMVDFPAYKLQPGEYFVVYNRDPGDTILAGGVSVTDVNNGTQVNKGASHVYSVSDDLDLPSTGKFLLVLRSAHDQDNEPDAIKDIAGNGFFSVVETVIADPPEGFDGEHRYDTRLFPLNGWGTTADVFDFGPNTFASATDSFARETMLNSAGVYRPDSRADLLRFHQDDWQKHGYMGGTGYDRDIDKNDAPGTPGYANVAVNLVSDDRDTSVATDDYAFSGTVTISEIMYDAGPRWNLVQWIELYNSSMTETIDLNGWMLEIRNKEDVESYVDSSFKFVEGTSILPNQTLLLVSGAGANDVDSNRVYNLYAHHRRELGLLARDSVLLSRTGFFLRLIGKASVGGVEVETVIDEAGNVAVTGATRTIAWALPARDPAARQSLVRQYGTRDIDGTPDAADVGIMATSWMQSDLTGAGLSFYGHRNDISTPGYRLGGPLPVSLSSFRPVRDKTTGEIVIKWVTESELNNAGFNILRSESKDGEFQLVNLKGIIAGNGTTSERHVYEWTDTTAKPNVVYYYQIEDVSLDGKRTTLTTTHLRGNVTVAGKATTTWGDLKLRY